MSNVIKYSVLLTLGVLILWIIIPFGDYTAGLLTALFTILLVAIFMFFFFIITIGNVIKVYKIKQKFDFIPLYITAIFSIFIVFIFTSDNKKFWTTVVITSEIADPNSNGGSLTLYKNNSFKVVQLYTDYSETYQGNYTIKNDTLFLDRKNLSAITDSLFTITYIWKVNDSTLIPLNKKFSTLKVQKEID